MTEATDTLIDRLSRDLRPVKRLAPPFVRAALWLGSVAALGALFVVGFSDMPTFMRRASEPRMMLELTGTLLTGILAVIAAFQLSLPDRTLRWAVLPLPSFLLWIGSSGYSCWRQVVVRGPGGLQAGEGARCFLWIIAFGVPLAASMFLFLRRARPLSPGPVAAMAGLGVASLAAFLLQFFHPFDVTFLDLGAHLSAVGAVVIAASAAARPGLDGRKT